MRDVAPEIENIESIMPLGRNHVISASIITSSSVVTTQLMDRFSPSCGSFGSLSIVIFVGIAEYIIEELILLVSYDMHKIRQTTKKTQ